MTPSKEAERGDRKINDAALQRAEERDLLRRVLVGEVGAWKEFNAKYERLITACVMRVLRRYHVRLVADDLHDLVADVWVALLRDDCKKLRRFDPDKGCRLNSWVGLIATNNTIDYLRVRHSTNAYLEDTPHRGHALVEATRPDSNVEREQRATIARLAISRLKAEEQRFVCYCFRDEWKPNRIAREMGISVNTVHSRKFKLRAKLTRIVAEISAA